MTLGTNLLLQWWSQNQGPYAPTPQLWIEADSWGQATWKNKGDGGYDLYVNNGRAGSVSGDAILSNADARADRNVLGTGSWTMEAVIRPSANNTWLMTQRTNAASTVPDGSVQVYISSNGYWMVGAYHPAGTNVGLNMANTPSVELSTVQYVACGYNAVNKVIWKRVNDQYAHNDNVEFSCTVDMFALMNAMFANISYNGRLYSFRVYQRALSDAEIAANYAADKRRFNF
jgi:hypothetical protein